MHPGLMNSVKHH